MKKIYIMLLVFIFSAVFVFAQGGLLNNGAKIIIDGNAKVVAKSSYISQNDAELDLTDAGSELYVEDDWNCQNNNAITSASQGKVIFNGASTSTTQHNFTGTYATEFPNVKVETGSVLTIGDYEEKVNNTLQIIGKVEVPEEKKFTIKDMDMAIGSEIILQNTNLGKGPGSLIITGDVTGAKKTCTFQKVFIPNDTKFFVTIPFEDNEVNKADLEISILTKGDGTTSNSTFLERGVVYKPRSSADGQKSISGTFSGSNLSAPFSIYTYGYFLPNPYTSAISLDKLRGTYPGISKDMYYCYEGNLYVYDLASGVGLLPDGKNLNGYVAPFNAVFFYFSNYSDNGDVTLLDEHKVHKMPNSNEYMKNGGLTNRLSLTVNGDKKSDALLLYTRSSAENSFDEIDTKKFPFNWMYANGPKIASKTTDGVEAVLNAFPEFKEGMKVPVTFSADYDGDFEISTTLFEIPVGLTAVLEDRLINTFTDLSTDSYKFSHSQHFMKDRFIIHFTSLGDFANKFADNQDFVKIFAQNNTALVVLREFSNEEIDVFDVAGRKILNKYVKSTVTQIPINKTGVYIVRVKKDKQIYNQKIYIK